ncbi:MAG: DUF3224 domain-containing protein [Chloroflexota bacterium]
MQHAESSFVIDSWEGDAYDKQEGAELARAHVTKTFDGDLKGTSSADILTAVTQAGPAAYVGLERITCTLHGLPGTFVLHHTAGLSGNHWTVVQASGTGDLQGLSGTAQIARHDDGSHTFTLDYELP